jgi:hypothetical protein
MTSTKIASSALKRSLVLECLKRGYAGSNPVNRKTDYSTQVDRYGDHDVGWTAREERFREGTGGDFAIASGTAVGRWS